MLISTVLLLDNINRNSVCTPAKLPCRWVVEGFVLTSCDIYQNSFDTGENSEILTVSNKKKKLYMNDIFLLV
jgi:hypothetical protein